MVLLFFFPLTIASFTFSAFPPFFQAFLFLLRTTMVASKIVGYVRSAAASIVRCESGVV